MVGSGTSRHSSWCGPRNMSVCISLVLSRPVVIVKSGHLSSPTMANDARQRMVRTMSRLLQRQGFHATGLNQVVTESQAPKGSIYHHFPGGKEQLTIEAITTSGAGMAKGMAAALASGASAGVAIRSLIDGSAKALERSGFEQGCP